MNPLLFPQHGRLYKSSMFSNFCWFFGRGGYSRGMFEVDTRPTGLTRRPDKAWGDASCGTGTQRRTFKGFSRQSDPQHPDFVRSVLASPCVEFRKHIIFLWAFNKTDTYLWSLMNSDSNKSLIFHPSAGLSSFMRYQVLQSLRRQEMKVAGANFLSFFLFYHQLLLWATLWILKGPTELASVEHWKLRSPEVWRISHLIWCSAVSKEDSEADREKMPQSEPILVVLQSKPLSFLWKSGFVPNVTIQA